ncbi:NAD(P)/FAD-dependent oxidoreductase [Streptomyces sp. NPDC020362]|uniref:phytoene desaturase family protein n=1 Tax=unclassified Streptomyces TaxID=2593676 RepID=UPI00340413FF
MTSWDVVVVGSGLGGLTCAAYLAACGRRTLVLEQNKVAGGCSQVFRRAGNRYEFDVGVHYIGECHPEGAITTALRGLGLDDRIEFRELDPDGFTTLVLPGLTFRVPRGWDAYLRRLVETFPAEERGLRRCIAVFRRIAEERRRGRPGPGILGKAAWARRAPVTATVGMLPVARLLGVCGLSPLACAVILGESGDYGAPPSRAPIALHAGLLDLFIDGGAYYPRGGGQVFAARLIDVVQAHGGQVRTKATVERILVEEGRAVGVRLDDGETIEAAAVVSNADIKRTYLELVGREHLSARTVARVEQYRMALPFFSVYLGLDIDLADRLPNTTYWCHPDADTERAYRNAYSGKLSGELPVFLTSTATKDPGNPRSAPPGHSTLEVMTLVSPDHAFWRAADASPAGLEYRSSPAYQEVKERLTEALIDRAGTVSFPTCASTSCGARRRHRSPRSGSPAPPAAPVTASNWPPTRSDCGVPAPVPRCPDCS